MSSLKFKWKGVQFKNENHSNENQPNLDYSLENLNFILEYLEGKPVDFQKRESRKSIF